MRHSNGRVQLVAVARKRFQLRKCLALVRRLGEKLASECERLVSANDVMSAPSQRHEQRLLARKQRGNLARFREARFLLDGPLVNLGGRRLEFETGILQQQFSCTALRGQDQGMSSSPERHSG